MKGNDNMREYYERKVVEYTEAGNIAMARHYEKLIKNLDELEKSLQM